MADIMTSYTIAFTNLSAAFCLIYCIECREENVQLKCHMNFAIPAVIAFPVLIRIFQCANLIHYRQKTKIEIVNIIKYSIHATDLVLGWAYKRRYISLITFIIIISISSTYLVGFDFRIDWNLLHWKSKNFLLRDKLLFPKPFYYFAMITNFALRYFWYFSLVATFLATDWVLLIANFLEISRRAQWCLIRFENEQLYNLEGYRRYLPVPQLILN